ncbi:MAG TPA: hypothetical protein VFP84_34235 [Kofleriaceae bacterium]|nr:hypothetical protein [Kofleriaceae bacterium]
MTRAVVLAIALAACGPKIGPNGVTSDDAIVVIQSNVRDAQVFLDGRLVAPLEALRGGVAMEPGAHRLELRHEDYFTRYVELTVARAERKRLTVDLAAILP